MIQSLERPSRVLLLTHPFILVLSSFTKGDTMPTRAEDLVERSNECTSGKSWYVCTASSFSGCCSVDACQPKGCPDMEQSPISSQSLTIITLSTIPQAPPPSPTTTSVLAVAPLAMSTTPTAMASSQPTTAKTPNNTPIIVGITCGIVAASILTIVGWFLWRRRSQREASISSRSTYDGKEGKEYEMARQCSIYEGSRLRPSRDGLGGYNTPSEASRSARSPSPMESVDARRSLPSQVSPPENVVKESKAPAQTNLVYHPLPGKSPTVPAWEPQRAPTPTTPRTALTPLHYSPQQKSHPAYHVHQLSQHPAFRPGASPPRSHPPLWKHPAFRPPPTADPALLDSTPIIPQNELEAFSFPKPRNASLPRPSSSSELPAEVPRTFLGSASDPNMISRFNQQASEPCSQASSPASQRQYRHTMLTRDASTKTGVSTYTIPIGLGVVDGSPTVGTLPFSLRTPADNDLTPAPLRPTSPPPPMKANMNEREDHIMSWSSYGAGQLSGIGPSESTGSQRSRRQREIEQGIIAREQRQVRRVEIDEQARREAEMWSQRNGLGKVKVWMNAHEGRTDSYGDMPETPMSAYMESWAER